MREPLSRARVWSPGPGSRLQSVRLLQRVARARAAAGEEDVTRSSPTPRRGVGRREARSTEKVGDRGLGVGLCQAAAAESPEPGCTLAPS